MQVTTSNNKATPFHIICVETGLYMADATPDFHTLAITQLPSRAFVFPCQDAAEHGRKFLKSIYPSFDWQTVPTEV